MYVFQFVIYAEEMGQIGGVTKYRSTLRVKEGPVLGLAYYLFQRKEIFKLAFYRFFGEIES